MTTIDNTRALNKAVREAEKHFGEPCEVVENGAGFEIIPVSKIGERAGVCGPLTEGAENE